MIIIMVVSNVMYVMKGPTSKATEGT